MSNISQNGESDGAKTVFSESGSEYAGSLVSEFAHTTDLKIVLLGKYVAPAIGAAGDEHLDGRLVKLALDGYRPDQIARRVDAGAAEVTIRLVELRTGPLGCIRPASGTAVSGGFADVKRRRSHLRIPVKQKPILSLVARAFGHRLQRLVDRLYLGGKETTLPDLVRLARDKGVRIRYPRLDPMDDAWNTGPSRLPSADSDALPPGWLQ